MPKSLKNEFYSSYRWKIYPFREHKVTGEPVSLWGSNCIDAEDREIKRWGKDGIHVQPCEMENWEMNRLSAAMTTKSKPWFLEWLIIHLANPGWCQENDRCECEVCLQEKKWRILVRLLSVITILCSQMDFSLRHSWWRCYCGDVMRPVIYFKLSFQTV